MTHLRSDLKKVLMVLEATFPVKGGGGSESQVLTLGKCLIARGAEVQVVVPMVANGPQIGRECVEGLNVVRIAYPKVRLLGGTIMLARLAWFLFEERNNYAFIHAHIANNMAAVCAVMGKLLNRPVLVKLSGGEIVGGILEKAPTATTKIKKWSLRRADLLQATSTRIRKMLVDAGFQSERIRLLQNGVDVHRFAVPQDPAFRKTLCGDASVVGIFVGRLAAEKGLDALLRSWATAFEGGLPATLVLVGDGPERERLKALAAHLNLGSKIVFAGHSSDVAKLLAIADFGLLTSLSEGLSNSLLEYMAAGLPVVGSRVSGTEDFIVPGETGWLFEPGQGEELTECLRRIVLDGDIAMKEMGRNARQKIINTASLEAVTNQLIGLYQFKNA